ncbi:MAG: TM0106 family RecB-like putative nuclease, partial [bacterium]|nr:TM0106 family RecB-like putative nuclease [bacterium]
MPEKKPRITAEHFYKFFQCPHWIWYDLYEDQKKKKTVPPLIQMIYEDGLRHEKEIIAGRKFEEINTALFKDLDEAFLATVEMMKQGKNIYHGVLMDEHWVGIPDLLESRRGKSKLGDHYYVVYDIKNSKEIKDEHKFQLVFYSLMLEQIQGVRPEEAYIINSEGEQISFLIDDFLNYFHLTLGNIEKILDGQKPPPFLKSGCKKTPWYSLCLSETEGCRDVSLIFSLKQIEQRQLYEVGIKTINQMASSSMAELQEKLEGWSYDKIVRCHNQAQSLVKNEMLVLKKSEFPDVKTEIYFDIEGDPTRGIDYLLGILIKDKTSASAPQYKYFLAKDKQEEKKIWEEFTKFIEGLDDFVIYHYAFYEKLAFNRFALQYGVDPVVAEKFK